MQSKFVFLCFAAMFLMAATIVHSENAFYIPRSFYVIDSAGHQSAPAIIGARHQNAMLHRLKRAATGKVFTPSSSRHSRVAPLF